MHEKGQPDMRNTISLLPTLIVTVLCFGSNSGTASAQAPALTAVQVFPPEVSLFTSRGRSAFVVQATYNDGITRDVTDEAKAAVANPALARLDKNALFPVADGATELVVAF